MSGTNHMTEKARADKCAFLLDECSRWHDNRPSPFAKCFEAKKSWSIDNFLRGIWTIQLLPTTEPEEFDVPHWTAGEALRRDWYAVGEDLYQVLVREIQAEIKRPLPYETSVESTHDSKTGSTFIR